MASIEHSESISPIEKAKTSEKAFLDQLFRMHSGGDLYNEVQYQLPADQRTAKRKEVLRETAEQLITAIADLVLADPDNEFLNRINIWSSEAVKVFLLEDSDDWYGNKLREKQVESWKYIAKKMSEIAKSKPQDSLPDPGSREKVQQVLK
jgi:hypothetical protein